jgi:diguanylate cyclase (GGDEF)-like protein/PAS domain S-box-containing protein
MPEEKCGVLAEELRILDYIPLGALAIDQGYRVLFWNKCLESWSGIKAMEICGRDLRRFFPNLEQAKFSSRIDSVLSGGPPAIFSSQLHQYVIPCELGNAKIRMQHTTVTGIRDRQSGQTCALFTLQDVTETHNRLQEYLSMRNQVITELSERRQIEAALRVSEEKYRELSIRDGLTNLYNSRHFHQQIEVEIGRANRYQRPLSIILMDMDDFKHYNDTYGHSEGDKALTSLSRLLNQALRTSDTAYRYGGEEFVIILSETHILEALIVAERIRSGFEAIPLFPLPQHEAHKTVSIGVAQLRSGEKTIDFINRADANMYKAKAEGKNCIVFEEAEPPLPIGRG